MEILILQIHQANPRAWHELAGVSEAWTRLPPTEECCGRVMDFLVQILHDLLAMERSETASQTNGLQQITPKSETETDVSAPTLLNPAPIG